MKEEEEGREPPLRLQVSDDKNNLYVVDVCTRCVQDCPTLQNHMQSFPLETIYVIESDIIADPDTVQKFADFYRRAPPSRDSKATKVWCESRYFEVVLGQSMHQVLQDWSVHWKLAKFAEFMGANMIYQSLVNKMATNLLSHHDTPDSLAIIYPALRRYRAGVSAEDDKLLGQMRDQAGNNSK